MLSDRELQVVQELEAQLLADAAFRHAVLPIARRLSARSAPVVVGVPGHGRCADAVRWAAAEAAGQGCPLRLVQAVPTPVGGDPCAVAAVGGDQPGAQGLAARALASAAALARSVAPELRVSAYQVQGPPARVLLAQSEDARLLVLGATAPRLPRGILGRLLGGSLRLRVVEAASCPVAVVHALPAEPCSDRTPRVVVGVNGSAGSDDAVGFAFRCAYRRGIGLTAVHAWSADRPADLEAVTAPLVTTEAAAYALTDGTLAPWQEQYPDVPVTTVVVRRDPATALLSASAGAALVVVGSRQGGRARRAVFGSVSRAVLDGAPATVAVVRRTPDALPTRRRVGR